MGTAKALLLATVACAQLTGRSDAVGGEGSSHDGSSAADLDASEDGGMLPTFPDTVSPVERVAYVTLAVSAVVCLGWTVRWLVQKLCCTKYDEIDERSNTSASVRDGSAIGTRLCKSSNQHPEGEYLM